VGEREPIRLLHVHSEHGYTDRPAHAMRDEPEAVPASYQRRLASSVTASPGRAVARMARRHRPPCITGSDFLMDGGVTASYFYGELAPSEPTLSSDS
jgi:hypothetical protein